MHFHKIARRLLGAPSRVAVLSALLSNPDRELTGRELAREAGVSHPQAMEALRAFEWEGVVRQRRVGRAGAWTANPDHFLSEHLGRLGALDLMARRELLSMLEPPLRAAGATEAYLFGSVARGTEEATSDIDVLVVFPSEANAERFAATLEPLRERVSSRFGNELQVLAYGAPSLRRKSVRKLLQAARHEGTPLEVGR